MLRDLDALGYRQTGSRRTARVAAWLVSPSDRCTQDRITWLKLHVFLLRKSKMPVNYFDLVTKRGGIPFAFADGL